MIRGLEFDHGYGAEPFSMYDESDGTLAWLALAVPAIDRLRKGGLFVVDELGSSLHPHLAEALIGFFQNPEINTRGAQILFTSHDFYLISNQSSLDFEKGQVWFTERSATVRPSCSRWPTSSPITGTTSPNAIWKDATGPYPPLRPASFTS